MLRAIPLLIFLLVAAPPTLAQVVIDGSIGTAGPGLVPSGTDPNGDFADYLIEDNLGEISGTSLYHRFSEFSVGSGEVATFTGPDAIEVVVANNIAPQGTFIFGLIRSTMPNAEIFFASPGGIVIGEGAELDVPGSFHFTTATTIEFDANPAFDLPTDSMARPTLLSSAPPSAFGFGPAPAAISIGAVDPTDASRTISVPSGETLSFVGGDIVLTGVPNESPFFYQGDVIGAPGANVEMASTSGDQVVPLRQVDGRTRIDADALPADFLDGDIVLQQNARIDVATPGGSLDAGGSFLARAGSFRISDGRIETGHRADLVDGGSIDIGTRDSIAIDRARLTAGVSGVGRGGDILLESEEITLGEGTLIRLGSTAGGDGGDFEARASTITLDGESEILTFNRGAGAGGDIRLVARNPSGTGRLELRGAGTTPTGFRAPTTLFSNPTGSAPGGAIQLEADEIFIADNADVLSITRGDAAAPGGGIDIQTTRLTVESGSFVTSSTESAALGGSITVAGLDGASATSVLVQNFGGEPEPARIATNTLSTAMDAGMGGGLEVRTDTLALIRGGQLFARTEGAGDAGLVEIFADQIQIEGILANPNDPDDPFRSGITSRVGDIGTTGSGTLLSIDTRLLDVANGGQISTSTFGVGNAAPLRIVSREGVTVRGGANGASFLSAQAVAGPTAAGGGNGGLLTIETARLEVIDGGQISAGTAGLGDPGEVGDAGDIVIDADDVVISGAAGFAASGIFSKSDSAASQGVGDGGDVTLDVENDLMLADGGRIEVSASGDGDAGNIRIDVGGKLAMSGDARISSSTGVSARGSSGSVVIVALDDVTLEGGSEISASTGDQSTGQGGVVVVDTTGALTLGGGSQIRSQSEGFGNAGDIDLRAGSLFATEASAISTEAERASGGSINIASTGDIELRQSSATTSVQGAIGSDAGSIEITTPGLVIVNQSAIVAQADQGAGGRIEVSAANSLVSGDSLISASSARGPQGVVDVTPPEDALISELASLPAALQDPSQLLRSACDLRTEREGSFTVRARPPVEPSPGDVIAPLEGTPGTGTQPGCD